MPAISSIRYFYNSFKWSALVVLSSKITTSQKFTLPQFSYLQFAKFSTLSNLENKYYSIYVSKKITDLKCSEAHRKYSSLQLGGIVNENITCPKKRAKRRVGALSSLNEETEPSVYPVVAYATCEELNLEQLTKGLKGQGLYLTTTWGEDNDSDLEDVIHVTAKYPIGLESREIFFFRQGSVVFWNVPDLERHNCLKFLKEFELNSYDLDEIMDESEVMLYCHGKNELQRSTKLTHGKIQLNPRSEKLLLDKYTVANALALSVKLGIWESSLDKFVDSIDHITEDLKDAKQLKLTRGQVLQKTGELFALRNELNLNSDLLDTPDFYWEHEDLESLYHKMYNYLSISRRTGVMNEKLSQCCEFLEIISGHLNDKHHVRLEWMIIALITIEVVMETVHIIERYT